MLKLELSAPSPEQTSPKTLADLSRNASVISSSSSSSSISSPPVRPRPLRTFSPPRSRSRDGPQTPRSPRPPAYLARELGLGPYDRPPSQLDLSSNGKARSKSRTKSRNSSLGLRLQASDFQFGDILGEGSYSTVMHAVYPPTEQEYAIKVLDKNHLKRNNKLQTALAEKNTLVRLGSGHPGVVRLHWAFHDEWSLYFVLDLARNGELQTRISTLGSLSLECARFYAAQIIDAVAYMHSKGVIHRDLKPENLLLDDEMRIKITDFGTGKLLDSDTDRANTFVGTAQYVSPELLTTNTTYRSSDLWAVGCIIYQMISGKFTFQGLSEYLTWQKIKNLEYSFPEDFDPVAKDLVQKLLVLEPSARLGSGEPGSPNDMDALRSHPFFEGIDWGTLWTGEVPHLRAGIFKRVPQANGWGNTEISWDDLVNGNNGYPKDELSDGEDEGNSEYTTNPYFPSDLYNRTNHEWPTQNQPYQFGVQPDAQDEEEFSRNAANHETTRTSPLTAESHVVPGVLNLDNYSLREANLSSNERQGTRDVDPAAPKITMNGETRPVDIPRSPPRQEIFRGSATTESPTSSSDGSSPVEKINAALQAVSLGNEDDRRGRERIQTPIQHGINGEWSSLLGHGETLLFHSDIEEYSRTRRLTVTLLPIPVSTGKRKVRHLLLTDRRLLCVKSRPGQGAFVKNEFLLSSQKVHNEKERDEKRDGRCIVDAMLRGDKELLILTGSKTHYYIASDNKLASRWLDEIRTTLRNNSSSPSTPPERNSTA